MLRKFVFLFIALLVMFSLTSCKSIYVDAHSSHFSSGYYIQLMVNDPKQTISSVDVTGPGISGSLTLIQGIRPNQWWSQPNINLGTNPPSLPLIYTFSITDDAGNRHTLQDKVMSHVESFATNLSPSGRQVATDKLIFTWQGINLPGVRYMVQLENDQNNRIWDSPIIESVSIPFDGPALAPGIYKYYVVAISKHGDESLAQASFELYDGVTSPSKPTRNIFIAAGHGGGDPGAVYHGTNEAKEVIEIVDETLKYLKGQDFKEWNIVLVPHELRLKETIEWVNERASAKDITIEIHLDAPSTTAMGPLLITVNTKEAQETSVPLLKQIAEVLGIPSRGYFWNENKIWSNGSVGFGLINQCKTSSAILEIDMLSNPERAEILKDAEKDNVYALALAKGILRTIGSEYR